MCGSVGKLPQGGGLVFRAGGWRRGHSSQITVKQVADAKTVDALAEALKANEPDVVACVADSKADYESKTA